MNGNGYDSTNGHNGHKHRMAHDGVFPNDDAEAIKDRMATLRRGLQEDAAHLAHTAKQATDWKFYVEKFPFACAGLALLVGYALIPPKRGPLRASDEQLEKLAKSGKLKVVAEPDPPQKQSLARKAMFAVGGLVLRAALDHVSQSLGSPMATRRTNGFHPPGREV
jgi:predicted RNase H-like nuclease